MKNIRKYSYLNRVLELDPNNEKAQNLIEELKRYLESIGKSLADLEDKSKSKTGVKLNQTLPFNSNISSNLSNLGNATIIDGLPVTVSLVYKDGKLDFANNVIYKVKFDIPNEDFTIKKYDKGTFENVSQIDRNTFIFKTNQILRDETKSGLVVFNFQNDTNKDRKLKLSTEVTINGKTQTTIIDPNPQSYLDIGTKIIQLSRDTLNSVKISIMVMYHVEI